MSCTLELVLESIQIVYRVKLPQQLNNIFCSFSDIVDYMRDHWKKLKHHMTVDFILFTSLIEE